MYLSKCLTSKYYYYLDMYVCVLKIYWVVFLVLCLYGKCVLLKNKNLKFFNNFLITETYIIHLKCFFWLFKSYLNKEDMPFVIFHIQNYMSFIILKDSEFAFLSITQMITFICILSTYILLNYCCFSFCLTFAQEISHFNL